MQLTSVSTTGLGGVTGQEVQPFGAGQRCGRADCGQPLSIYNRTGECFRHPEIPRWEHSAWREETKHLRRKKRSKIAAQ